MLLLAAAIQGAELVSREHDGGTTAGALVGLIVGRLHEVENVHATRKEGRQASIYGGYVFTRLRQAVEVSGGTAPGGRLPTRRRSPRRCRLPWCL